MLRSPLDTSSRGSQQVTGGSSEIATPRNEVPPKAPVLTGYHPQNDLDMLPLSWREGALLFCLEASWVTQEKLFQCLCTRL